MSEADTHPIGIVGKHLIYTYDNGWQYELYIKNDATIDYRIHRGIVGGRWVKDQPVSIAALADTAFRISWTEPTGTSVSLVINLDHRELHGVVFFPQWVVRHPERTILFQNDHLAEMQRYRDEGPTYPIEIIDEFAEITFVEDCGTDDDGVIACPPDELPADYASRIS